jgi:hypothetical protein
MEFIFKAELLDDISPENAARLINDDRYGTQDKRNGRRRTILKDKDKVFSLSRKGEARELPSALVAALKKHPLERFVIDTELEESGIAYAFDVLVLGEELIAGDEYSYREERLHEEFDGFCPQLVVLKTARTSEEKALMLQELQDSKAEGIVFKKMSAAYLQGKAHQHFKLKFWKTVDAVVTRLNYGTMSSGSMLKFRDSAEFSVYDESGELYRICDASLIGKPKLTVGDVAELKYLYATSVRRVVQPTIMRKRDDKKPEECTIAQLVINRDMMSKLSVEVR